MSPYFSIMQCDGPTCATSRGPKSCTSTCLPARGPPEPYEQERQKTNRMRIAGHAPPHLNREHVLQFIKSIYCQVKLVTKLKEARHRGNNACGHPVHLHSMLASDVLQGSAYPAWQSFCMSKARRKRPTNIKIHCQSASVQ